MREPCAQPGSANMYLLLGTPQGRVPRVRSRGSFIPDGLHPSTLERCPSLDDFCGFETSDTPPLHSWGTVSSTAPSGALGCSAPSQNCHLNAPLHNSNIPIGWPHGDTGDTRQLATHCGPSFTSKGARPPRASTGSTWNAGQPRPAAPMPAQFAGTAQPPLSQADAPGAAQIHTNRQKSERCNLNAARSTLFFQHPPCSDDS